MIDGRDPRGPAAAAAADPAASSLRAGRGHAFLGSPEQRIAWARERFFEAGERPPQGWMDEAILQSWRRCLKNGRRPQDAPVFEPVSASRTRSALDRHHALLAAADPEIDQLARLLAGTGCMTLLTDRRGIAMRAIRPQTASPLLQASGRVGVDLGEPGLGGTAPGIVAEAAVACTVSGGEHFFSALQQVHCVAAPIRNLRGEVAGVLDLTIDGQPFGFDAATLVRLSALAIERRLVTGQLTARGHWLLHFHTRPEWLDTAMAASVAFDEDGRVVWSNAAARALCPMLEEAHPRHAETGWIDGLAGLRAAELQSAGRDPAGARGEAPPRLARLLNGLGVWWRVQPPRSALSALSALPADDEAPVRPAAGGLAAANAALAEPGPRQDPSADAGPGPDLHPPAAGPAPASGLPAPTTLDAANRLWIESVLQRHHGNVSQAARELGVSRGLLYRRIAQWGLGAPRRPPADPAPD